MLDSFPEGRPLAPHATAQLSDRVGTRYEFGDPAWRHFAGLFLSGEVKFGASELDLRS